MQFGSWASHLEVLLHVDVISPVAYRFPWKLVCHWQEYQPYAPECLELKQSTLKGGEGRGSGKGLNSRHSGHWKLEKVFFNESVSTILQLVVASAASSFLRTLAFSSYWTLFLLYLNSAEEILLGQAYRYLGVISAHFRDVKAALRFYCVPPRAS